MLKYYFSIIFIISVIICFPVFAYAADIEGDNNYLDGASADDEEIIINAPSNNDIKDKSDDNDNDDNENDVTDKSDSDEKSDQEEYTEDNSNEADYESYDNYDEDPEEGDDKTEENSNNNEEDNKDSEPYQITVNTELTREDIETLEAKIDKLADLIYKLTISAWSLAGLYMGTKLLRGIFDG